MRCNFCKDDVVLDGRVHFRDECPYCGADLHICKNCGLFDPFAHHQCRETSAELVSNKEKMNHCEYFQISVGFAYGNDALDARNKLEALFRK